MTSRLFPPHVREQSAPLAPLTVAQQLFAAEHHDLIYAFLHRKGVNVNEYYDIAAMGFLHAVQRYLTQPWLRRYAFPTIAWRAMGQSLAMDCRAEIRRKKAERLYLECCQTHLPDIREEAESRLILHDALSMASPEQYRLAGLRAQGYNVKEAAKMQGIQVKQAHRILAELRNICMHLYI